MAGLLTDLEIGHIRWRAMQGIAGAGEDQQIADALQDRERLLQHSQEQAELLLELTEALEEANSLLADATNRLAAVTPMEPMERVTYWLEEH